MQKTLASRAGAELPVVSGPAGMPGTSFGPPLHLCVLALQIGHGWRCAESSTHEPAAPPQSASMVHLRPRLTPGLVVPGPHRFGSMSPFRKTCAVSGMLMLAE